MAKGIAHLGILFSLIIYSGHANALLVSDLLISEVMANPAALTDARGEWFELYNPTDHEINLRGIWIGDDGLDSHKIETDLLILPSEYLTLARNADPGFSPDYVYDNFTLGNGADEIVFSDDLKEWLRLDYSVGFVEAGRSSELTALPMLASNYALSLESLTYGAGDIGTPGSAGNTNPLASVVPVPTSIGHSVSAVPAPATIWLFISGLLTLLTSSVFSRRTPVIQQNQTSIPCTHIVTARIQTVTPRLLTAILRITAVFPGTRVVIPGTQTVISKTQNLIQRFEPMRRTDGIQQS